MHTDSVMKRVLGVDEKISPDKCFYYWRSRIMPDFKEHVEQAMRLMINSGKAVQLEYRWLHPTFGEVSVRSSGIRTQDAGRMMTIEGYHRIRTGVEGA